MDARRATAILISAAFILLIAIKHGFRGVRVGV